MLAWMYFLETMNEYRNYTFSDTDPEKYLPRDLSNADAMKQTCAIMAILAFFAGLHLKVPSKSPRKIKSSHI